MKTLLLITLLSASHNIYSQSFMYTTAKVQLMKDPNPTGKGILLLEPRSKVQVVSEHDSLWTQVKYGGTTGYLTNNLLEAETANIRQSVASKGDNFIIIQTTDNAEAAYKKVAMLLQDKGYTLKNSDKDLLSLSTDMLDNGFYGSGTMSLSAYVRGEENAQVFLSGQLLVAAISRTPSVIEFRGMKGSPVRNAFEKLEEVAQSYTGGALSYAKK